MVSKQAPVYSSYPANVSETFMYQPLSDVVLSDLQYYRQIGVAGNTVLMMNPQSWWAPGPHMYAYARAAWDSTVTLDEIDRHYLVSLYGRGAEPMRSNQQATRDLF